MFFQAAIEPAAERSLPDIGGAFRGDPCGDSASERGEPADRVGRGQPGMKYVGLDLADEPPKAEYCGWVAFSSLVEDGDLHAGVGERGFERPSAGEAADSRFKSGRIEPPAELHHLALGSGGVERGYHVKHSDHPRRLQGVVLYHGEAVV